MLPAHARLLGARTFAVDRDCSAGPGSGFDVKAAKSNDFASLETSAMYREWGKKMRARELEYAQRFVENTVDMVCLTLYEAVGREKGGNAASAASRKRARAEAGK